MFNGNEQLSHSIIIRTMMALPVQKCHGRGDICEFQTWFSDCFSKHLKTICSMINSVYKVELKLYVTKRRYKTGQTSDGQNRDLIDFT